MSPTPAEKKALVFFASILFLGGVVRATGAARRVEHADAASREALRRQIVAAESAAAVERRERSGRGVRRSARARRGSADGGRGEGAAGDAARAGAMARTSIFDSPAPFDRVDVDRASAEELERLPRIGPALAQRIVEDRARNGPYGSLEGFQRVRGIGPAMARQLASAVTFSGTPRPSNAGEAGGSPPTEGGARRRRKAARTHPPP